MKKLFALMIALVLCLCLIACSTPASPEVEAKEDTNTSMFVEVETAFNWYVVYHRETKVMYAVSRGTYNLGTFTVMLNADGTPMLWEG